MTDLVGDRTRIAVSQQALSLVLMVGFAVASARWLGPSGKGVLTLVTTAGFVGGSILGLGIPQALTVWVSRNQLSVRDALKLGFSFTAFIVALTWLVTRLPELQLVAPIAVLFLSMGVMLFEQVSSGVSNGAGDLLPQLVLRIVAGGLQVVVMMIAWLVAFPVSLDAILIGYYVPGALGVLLATYLLVRRNPGPPKRVRELAAAAGPLMGFGLAVVPAQLLSVTNFKLDVLVLGGLAGPSAVGVYSVAVSATLLVGLLPSAFGQVLTRTFGASSDPAPSLRRGIHAALVAGALSAVVLASVSPFLIPAVFGPEFGSVTLLIVIMVPATALFATVQISYPYFYNHLRNPLVHSLVIGVTAVVDVALLAVLAPTHGAIGAAIASSIAYTVGAMLNLRVTARASNIPMLELLIPGREDLAWMARTALLWAAKKRAV